MLLNDSVYNRFHLVKEMYETVDYIRVFKNNDAQDLISRIPAGMPLMITGEGSSRIYPAKNAVHQRLRQKTGPVVMTEWLGWALQQYGVESRSLLLVRSCPTRGFEYNRT